LPTRSFFAVPEEVENIDLVARKFAPLAKVSSGELKRRLRENKKQNFFSQYGYHRGACPKKETD